MNSAQVTTFSGALELLSALVAGFRELVGRTEQAECRRRLANSTLRCLEVEPGLHRQVASPSIAAFPSAT